MEGPNGNYWPRRRRRIVICTESFGVPFIIAYTAVIYWTFRHPVESADEPPASA